jgi:hypothetical protein
VRHASAYATGVRSWVARHADISKPTASAFIVPIGQVLDRCESVAVTAVAGPIPGP